tara:strand:- start:50 stop:223 length:174 start_codon:yes stop_codon:yes gene_type:complete
MATRYKKYADDPDLGQTNTIQRILEDGTKTCIPMVEYNRDYQEYLEWAKTNTIEEPD